MTITDNRTHLEAKVKYIAGKRDDTIASLSFAWTVIEMIGGLHLSKAAAPVMAVPIEKSSHLENRAEHLSWRSRRPSFPYFHNWFLSVHTSKDQWRLTTWAIGKNKALDTVELMFNLRNQLLDTIAVMRFVHFFLSCIAKFVFVFLINAIIHTFFAVFHYSADFGRLQSCICIDQCVLASCVNGHMRHSFSVIRLLNVRVTTKTN